MNKEQFLNELTKSLDNTNIQDKKEFISYYDELISDAMESGKEEISFIANLGEINEIIKKAEMEITIKQAEENPNPRNHIKAILSILGIVSSPIWLTIAIILLLMLFIVILMGYVMVITLGCFAFSTAIFAIVSFFTAFSTPVYFIITLGAIGSTFLLLGIMLLLFKFIHHTITLKSIQTFKNLVVKKGGTKNV